MSRSIPRIDDLPAPPSDRDGWPWTHSGQTLSESKQDGKEWPKITIVTPSYNQAQFLEETIRSVLLQGYPNLEFIVMDGGSTDGSVEIIEKYEPWITHWISEEDEGQSDAINKGFEHATGDIYNWINSDDFLRPGALRAIGELFIRSETASWITGGRILRSVEHGTEEAQLLWPRHWPKYLLEFPDFPQDATFFRADVWNAVGGLDKNLQYGMDILFFHEMLDYTKRGIFTRFLLSCMNIHENQKTKGVNKRKETDSQKIRETIKRRPSRALFGRLLCTRFSPHLWNLWRSIAQIRAPKTFERAKFDHLNGEWELVPYKGVR